MDYIELGLRCGLEIHQQLDTKHKLFCKCKPRLSSDKPHGEITRKLRAVAGELGEIDIAAIHEVLRGKEYHYMVYPEETCLVCTDEEPPHEINMEAMEASLKIATMLNCEIPDEIHVMRKTVIDGSNTAGFQRTAIVGLNGWVETSFGKVGITNVSLEEESSQIIKKDKDVTVYGLDRLGIPLIEIGTAADIHTPEQAKETAEKIGMILRSTNKIKRGLGTIRQDLNVSIKGGERIEIKGVQALNLIPKIIENEVLRQLDFVKKNKSVPREVRKALPTGRTEFLRPLPGSARLYPETDSPPIRLSREIYETIKKEKVELIEDIVKRLEKQGLGSDLAAKIAKEKEYLELFIELSKYKNIKPAFIADLIVSYKSDLPKKYGKLDAGKITKEHLEKIFSELDSGNIAKDSVNDILADIARGHFDLKKYRISADINIEKEIEKLIQENKGLSFGALMGIAMSKYKGKVPGERVAELLKEKMK